MKKYLLILTVLLVFSSAATAATVDLQIISGPDPQGTDPCSGAPSYLPGDTITIALVASGFGTGPTDGIAYLEINSATTDNGGTASNPDLNLHLKGGLYGVGTPINSGGVLIHTVFGSTAQNPYPYEYPFGNLWWFDYQVPDLPYSSIITIDLTDLSVLPKYGSLTYTYGGALEIHVAEPPCCPGDTNNDGCYNLADFYRIMNDLSYANYLRTGGVGEPNYLIYDGCVTTGFLWDECCDVTGDGVINLADYNRVMNDISYAHYIRCIFPPCDPNYNIWPDNPTVGFLWPCN